MPGKLRPENRARQGYNGARSAGNKSRALHFPLVPSFPRKRDPKATRMRTPCVYILASKPRGTLYIGVTSDLAQRLWQHKHDLVDGFTKRYGFTA